MSKTYWVLIYKHGWWSENKVYVKESAFLKKLEGHRRNFEEWRKESKSLNYRRTIQIEAYEINKDKGLKILEDFDSST